MATQEKLSSEVGYVSTSDTTADQPTELLTWDVPDGREIRLREGHAAVADIETTGGSDPSGSTEIGFAYKEPGDPLDAWTVINSEQIGPFATLSRSQQLSDENAERRVFSFDPDRTNGGTISLTDVDELALLANGPDTLDGSTAYFRYPVTIMDA
jgi:hypothetical protein